MTTPATADLLLRPVSEADAPAILEAFDDPLMSRQGTVTDLAQAQAYAARLARNDYAFALDSGGRFAGVVVIDADAEHSLGWFWYWVCRDFRRRGLASTAARSLANWALTDGGLYRLELGHRANNPASGAVARAAGFIREGVEREKFLVGGQRVDVFTYGRLASDPIPDGPTCPIRRGA